MLILPRRFTRQPQGNVEIDWGNPITRNLVSAFLPNQRYPFIDLASKIVDNATSRLSVRQGILGVEAFNNTSTSWSLGFTSATRWQNQPQTASYPAISVFTLFQQFDTTSTGVIWGGGSNVTTYARFVKENTGAITFVPNSSTAGAGITTPTALDTDRPYALAGINSFNDRELFVDGTSVASSNSAITYTNAAVLAAGAPTAAQRNIGLFCGYVWTRRLTASEIKSLTDNPWQIFRPRRLVLPVEAGAATQTLTPSLYTNQQTFYAPTVTPGTVTLQPGLYTNTQSFYSPTVTVGTVTLLPDLFTNTNTIYPPTVLQAGLQTLLPDLFVNQNQFFPATIVGAGGGGMSKGWEAERRRLELSLEQRQATQTLAKSKNKVAKRVAKRIEQYVAAEIDAQAEIEQIAQLQVEIAKLEALHDNRKQFNQEMREAAQILKDFVQDEQDAITLLMLVDDFDTRCVIEATTGPLNLVSRMGSQ